MWLGLACSGRDYQANGVLPPVHMVSRIGPLVIGVGSVSAAYIAAMQSNGSLQAPLPPLQAHTFSFASKQPSIFAILINENIQAVIRFCCYCVRVSVSKNDVDDGQNIKHTDMRAVCQCVLPVFSAPRSLCRYILPYIHLAIVIDSLSLHC